MKYKTSTIGNIALVQTGPFGSQLHNKDYALFGTPIVTVEHLGNRKMTLQNLPRVSDADKKRLSKYTLQYGDLVFSRVGSVDRCSFVGEEEDGWMFSGRCLRIRPKNIEEIYPKYLYYFFCLESTKNFVRNIAVGATMPSINTKLLSDVPINFPSLEEQQIIGDTLSVLDDQIENNAKINRHLEQMAQAIFINFQENGMGSFRMLSEIVEINTDTYSINENWHFVEYLDTGSITNGVIEATQIIDTRTEKLPSRARRKVKHNDIIYSTVRPIQRHFGIISNLSEKMLVSTGFAVIRSTNPFVCNEYIYLHLTADDSIAYLQQLAEQSVSTYPAIKPSDIGACEIFAPSNEDGVKLHGQLAPLFDKMAANSEENACLAAIRDALLPRLMSGEIKVTNSE